MEQRKKDFNLYLFGGLIGAIIGVIAAIIFEKSSELDAGKPQLTKKKLTKLGFSTVSALWSLIDPGKGPGK